MGYEVILSSSIALTVVGLIVLWFGIAYHTFSPRKNSKQDTYLDGALFCALHILIPVIVFFLLWNKIDFFKNEDWNDLSFSLYLAITYLVITSFSNISKARKNKISLYVEKNIVKNNIKIFSNSICIHSHTFFMSLFSIFIACSQISYQYLTMKNNSEGPIFSISFIIAFFLLSLLLLTLIAALDGYNNSTFVESIVVTKKGLNLSGIVINHNEYLHFLITGCDDSNNEQILINSDCIFSIIKK